MLPTDSLSPYLLASMHPMLHLTMLFTSMVLIGLDQTKFYENTGTCPEGTPAYQFMTTGKTELMFTIMTSHLLCTVFHVISYQYFTTNKFWANVFLVAKVFLYIFSVVTV